MIDRIGACVFCGQTRMVKIPADAKENEENREATMQCNCDEAKAHQEKVTNINVAQHFIDNELIAPDGVKAVLKTLSEMVGYEQIDQAVIKLGGATYTVKEKKYKVSVEKKTVETTGIIL